MAVKLFGFDLSSAPIWAAGLLFFLALAFFTAMGVLLSQSYLQQRTGHAKILERKFPVNEFTAPILAHGVSVTAWGLIIGTGCIFVPTKTLHLLWIDFGGCVSAVFVTSLGASFWTLRRLKNLGAKAQL